MRATSFSQAILDRTRTRCPPPESCLHIFISTLSSSSLLAPAKARGSRGLNLCHRTLRLFSCVRRAGLFSLLARRLFSSGTWPAVCIRLLPPRGGAGGLDGGSVGKRALLYLSVCFACPLVLRPFQRLVLNDPPVLFFPGQTAYPPCIDAHDTNLPSARLLTYSLSFLAHKLASKLGRQLVVSFYTL